MSRNLCMTECHRCGFKVCLVEAPRQITPEDCGTRSYEKYHKGMLVANAECVLCGAKYLAWVDDRKNVFVGQLDGGYVVRARASEFELEEARRDGTDYFFDLSYRSTFDDEPGDDDLPPFDPERPLAHLADARYVRALEFYARIGNWQGMKDGHEESACERDMGATARAALGRPDRVVPDDGEE